MLRNIEGITFYKPDSEYRDGFELLRVVIFILLVVGLFCVGLLEANLVAQAAYANNPSVLF
jgi:hypothetical protein